MFILQEILILNSMSKKSDKTTAVNSITGKTLSEMSWDEIRQLRGKRLSQQDLIKKIKNVKSS
ncbi:hypothetical protein HNQ92_001127 [Rhabdobacter roseus]|uniref:Uncharacterized protein n=1 Tax=Rhabdobacter roseus TaxID=1655419 RepID=A0A840TI67_9BACT|nr:hypothetical protein [Rhabdobacter roseus]